MSQAGVFHILLAALAVLAAVSVLATQARADGLRFSLGYNYTLAESETKAASGETSDSRSSAFGQQYRIDFDRRLYPTLSLRGGGLFERSDSDSEVDSADSESSSTRTSPYINLLLSTPLYNAGLGFSRVEDRSESNGTEQPPLIRDTYNAAFGWRPADLPNLNLQYTRNDTYDRDRLQQDDTSQRFVFGSTYRPMEELGLSYQGTYSTSEDKLDAVRSEDVSHSARIDYTDRFWSDRVSLLGSYTYGQRHTEVVTSGIGEVETPLQFTPDAGLFVSSDNPTDVTLDSSPGLIDASFTDTFGIGLVLGPGELSELRNIGLQFPVETRMNALRVWVVAPGRDLLAIPQDRQDLTEAFTWQVFISNNGSTWTLHDTATAVFGPLQSRFELRFAPVATRFIKVVVQPLASGTALTLKFPDIQVTQMEATLFVPAADAEGSTSTSSHQLNMNVRTRLLESPSLYHNFSAFYTTVQPAAVSRIFISNSLSLLHRFHPKLSLSAQVGRDDTDEARGKTVIHRWGASLLATPVPALRQNLTYSGQISNDIGQRSLRNSLFLNNRATLYRGVDVLLNGGVSAGSLSTGEDTMNYLVNFGATVIPHPSMTWDFSLGANRSTRSGGGEPDSTTTNSRWRASLAYNPAPALGLFLAMERVKQPEQTRTLRNYSVNWSPFSGGTLQFNFGYSETLREETDTVDRSLSPNVTWEIRRGTFLAVSYALSESESPLQETTSRVFGASLRATF